MSEKSSELAAKIIHFRKEKGLSQEEAAFRSNISRTDLGRIERAECVPTIQTLSKLEKGLGLPLMTLFLPEDSAKDEDAAIKSNIVTEICNRLGQQPLTTDQLYLLQKVINLLTDFILS